jgi:hypothetical protein
LMPALRVTLTSAEAEPCIYQMALSPDTGESACPVGDRAIALGPNPAAGAKAVVSPEEGTDSGELARTPPTSSRCLWLQRSAIKPEASLRSP